MTDKHDDNSDPDCTRKAHERRDYLEVLDEAITPEVWQLLGHASIEMTMRYAHLAPIVRAAAVQALDDPAPSFDQDSKRDGDPDPWHRRGSR